METTVKIREDNSKWSEMSPEEKKEYFNKLKDALDKKEATSNPAQAPQFVKMTEKELAENDLVKDEEVHKMNVRRAYCKKCGAEIVCKVPSMFNPFTLEKQANYKCDCGEMYSLDHAYPRIVFLDENGDEIIAHCD